MQIWLINPYDELPGEGVEGRYLRLAQELADGSSVFVPRAGLRPDRWEMGGVDNSNIERPTSNVERRNEDVGEGDVTRGETSKVVWVSSGFRHRQKTRSESVEDRRLELGDGFTCMLVDAPAYRKNVSVGRLWSQWKWGRNVVTEMTRRVASGELEKPDVVLASSPPLEGAWAGIRLARRFGAVSVVDFMDDWPATWLQVVTRSSSENGGFGNLVIGLRFWVGKILLWPWFRLARKVYRSADAVSAQSHTFAARARELGHEGDVHVCYLGGSAAGDRRWQTERPSPEGGAFHILYLGSMGRVYDIETVLRAAQKAQEAGRAWQWTFAGLDPDGRWEAKADELGVSDMVSFAGFISGDELEKLKRSAHIGLVPMDPQSQVAVPYKVGDYLGAGLAVVNSLPGELEHLLSEHGVGEPYTFGDPDSLYSAVSMLADHPDKRQAAQAAALDLFNLYFDRDITYPAFAQWVKDQA